MSLFYYVIGNVGRTFVIRSYCNTEIKMVFEFSFYGTSISYSINLEGAG